MKCLHCNRRMWPKAALLILDCSELAWMGAVLDQQFVPVDLPPGEARLGWRMNLEHVCYITMAICFSLPMFIWMELVCVHAFAYRWVFETLDNTSFFHCVSILNWRVFMMSNHFIGHVWASRLEVFLQRALDRWAFIHLLIWINSTHNTCCLINKKCEPFKGCDSWIQKLFLFKGVSLLRISVGNFCWFINI